MNLIKIRAGHFLHCGQSASRIGRIKRCQPGKVNARIRRGLNTDISRTQDTVDRDRCVSVRPARHLKVRGLSRQFYITATTRRTVVTCAIHVAGIQNGAVSDGYRNIIGGRDSGGVSNIINAGKIVPWLCGFANITGEVIARNQGNIAAVIAIGGKGINGGTAFHGNIGRLQSNVSGMSLRRGGEKIGSCSIIQRSRVLTPW